MEFFTSHQNHKAGKMYSKDPKNTHCKWCSAFGCQNSKNKRPDLAFFRFPTDPQSIKKWIVNTRRKDLETKSSDQLKYCFLCSEHFEECCFSKTATKRPRLLKDAVPTIFNVPNPPPRITASRPPPKDRHLPETPVSSMPASPSCSSVDEIQSSSSPASSHTSHETEKQLQLSNSLKRKLHSERSKTSRLRKKLKLSDGADCKQSTTNMREAESSLEAVKVILKQHLPEQAASFILTQLRMSKLPAKGRRWTFQEKSFALSLWHTSKKAYSLLQQLFQLPTPRTLSLSMRNINISPGICENIMSLFKIKVSAMTTQEKVCSIIFDEMAIKRGLKYNPTSDIIEGFEDFGNLGRSQNQADHALVFMLRGLTTKWKQPISYVLSQGPIKASVLEKLLQDLIAKVIQLGLSPKVLVCDQGPNNRSVLTKLGVTEEKPFFIAHEQKLFVMYDPPHLIKNIRNNMKKSGFRVNDSVVSWDYIQEFYKMDSAMDIRMAPKLSSKHINVPAFSHLRVSLAVQVLSHTVAAGINTMIALKAMSPEAKSTANFIERFDQLFNCFNSRCLSNKSTMGHAISPNSRHESFLQEMLQWLSTVKPNNKVKKLPCLEGWKLSINSLMQLWQHLRDECGFKFLLTSRLNQDCLENLFAVIRGKGGHRVNPDATEFRLAFRQTMVDSVLVTGDNKNCKDDLDAFLFNFESLTSQGGGLSIRSRLKQDVPKCIQGIMQAPLDNSSELSSAESNILDYIGGYIVKKLERVLCHQCHALLQTGRSKDTETQTFLCQKNFVSSETGGLRAPSPVLQSLLTLCEAAFRENTSVCLHVSEIRYSLVRKLMQATAGVELQCQVCDLKFLVVNLFCNIRLHHLVRIISRESSDLKKSSARKAATFQHL